jgi:drug/metabolite transporter (DMT)-like permease
MPSIGLFLGLGAALAWGLTDVAGALAGRRVGSLPVLAGSQLVGWSVLAALAAVALAAGAAVPPLDAAWVTVSAACGVVAMVAYLAFLTALRIGPISIVSPTVAAYGGLTVVLAVVVRGESLAPIEVAGAIVATLGVMAVGFVVPVGGRFPRIRGPGVAFALVALVCFAVLSIVLADPIRQVGWLPTMLVSRTTNAAIGLAVLGLALVARGRVPPTFLTFADPGRAGHVAGLVLAAGLLDAVGLIAFAIGLEVAPVWLVGLASSLGPVVAVVFAVTFMGERPRPIQWVGLAAIAVGIMLVGLP